MVSVEIMGTAMWWLGVGAAVMLSTVVVPAHALHGQKTKSAQVVETKPADSLVGREVHHQLQVLPYYSVFDNIVATVDGSKVTLRGYAVRPTLKANAEAAVKSIEGVGRVLNEIEVLPESTSDDELRRRIYRAIYEDSELQKYAVVAVPAIHIVVKNGNVALEGFVESEADKNAAGTKAKSVANVAGVKNDLVVRAKESSRGK